MPSFLHGKLVLFFGLRVMLVLLSLGVISGMQYYLLPEKLSSIQKKRQQAQEALAQVQLFASLKKDAAELVPYTPKIQNLIPVLDFTSFNSSKQEVVQAVQRLFGSAAMVSFSDPASGNPGFENVGFTISATTSTKDITALLHELATLPITVVVSEVSIVSRTEQTAEVKLSGFIIFRVRAS